MLAPTSLRPGSSSGDADRRRRSRRLVVIAVVAAVLALLVPSAIALLVRDDAGAAPTGSALPTASAVPTASDVPTGSSAEVRADPATPAVVTTPAEPAPVTEPSPVLMNAGASTPVGDSAVAAVPTDVSTAPAAADPSTPSVAPTPVPAEPVVDEQTPVAAEPEPAPVVEQAANWMEALRPQIDPEGLATWVFEARGAWGASDGHTVFIDPDVPEDKRWSVMVHEYGHVLQVRHYGSLDATAEAMNAVVGAGPTDQGPTESNADCIAELLGATWTDYGCQDALRPAAAALVSDDRDRIPAS